MTEIELKFLLPGADPNTIGRLLARHPQLARRRTTERWLLNRYFDTPDRDLQKQRSALRLRLERGAPGPGGNGRWCQTFKTAGVSRGGLSQRGEWESPTAGGQLDRTALDPTPWSQLDPDDSLFRRLQPCFETHCHRTTWVVRRRDGSAVEVALDVGEVRAGGRTEALVELELELMAGPAEALFELARALGERVALLPSDTSKAERGYGLAAQTLHAPTRARPPRLKKTSPPLPAALNAMGEMMSQFTRNLASIAASDDPEGVHQARVAWRRWRSAARLFRPWLPSAPDTSGLRPLLDALGQQRDLDVALGETLPRWAAPYAGDDAERLREVAEAQAALQRAGLAQRKALRECLARPASGLALLELTQWLHGLETFSAPPARDAWAHERIDRLGRRLQRGLKAARRPRADVQQVHETRLLAKRLRYSVEALDGLLPRNDSRRWLAQATEVQTRLGTDRDLQQAATLLHTLEQAPGLVAFLHGVAAARAG